MSNRNQKRQRRAMWKKLDKKEAAALEANGYFKRLARETGKKYIWMGLFILLAASNVFCIIWRVV